VELTSIIRDAVETCQAAAEQLGHRLVIQLPAQPIFLQADAARLAQVVSNLLTNSCKYTEQNGQIVVSAKQQDGHVVIRVRDNGIGIPSTMLSHVFEMFVQIDQSLERTKGGLGIGLTLVKRIVEMHGGTVTANSEGLGKGSEFIVQLPVTEEAAPNQTNPSTSDPPSRAASRQKILVVDDNVDGAQSLAMMLRVLGNETRTAHDGLKAIDAAAEFLPDVILLDIGLPLLNGYDVCRQIRAHAWSKDTLIIALTGWGQDKDREQSAKAGFDHHLVKPVDLTALQNLLAARQPR
jgi:CheY-like chemotaxis protein/anti-sigma regulatory factor (Ser/Thr protein kinase)